MDKNVKEILERAAERYADDIIARVESTAYLPPPHSGGLEDTAC